ncbi:MAG TPA: matrixin family metalloprotease [Thermoanaerobaculia bacterium]|nr:matrixin family metalloprotease [Thermoanaerobaculia bacterium]
MRRLLRKLRILSTVAVALVAPPAIEATTYRMVADADLADQARAVAEVRVVEKGAAAGSGKPATDYLVEVERVVQGHLPGSRVVVRVPGGLGADGIGLRVYGAPEFAPGDRALLFLVAGEDGSYRILHLMLGAFHARRVAGRRVALRDLAGAHEVLPGPQGRPIFREANDRPRDLDRFADWLADRAAGRRRDRDYLLEETAAEGLQAATAGFTQMTSGRGHPIRWFRFERGETVSWRVHVSGQEGLGLDRSIGAFRTAMEAWNGDAGSTIRYAYAGTTSAGAGMDHSDGTNAILFDDPRREEGDGAFRCGSGGVIAVGGPFFYTSTRTFNGKTYHEAVEADIVTNDGTECFFRDDPRVAEEVFAHELGHTLGIGHSPNRGALMHANVHDDGRGARLDADDRDAVAAIYPSGIVPPPPPPVPVPAAPGELAAQGLARGDVRLTWRDNSGDELDFRIERSAAGGAFREVLKRAAGVTTATLSGHQPSTAYAFRVRARGAGGFSAYSNTASLKTGAAVPPAPTGLLAVARAPQEVLLAWRDNAQGELDLRIERSLAGGVFQEVGSVPANATGALVRGLAPGTAYAFRVRARGAAGLSPASNAAAATTPGGAAAGCGAGAPALCLLGGRVRVEVTWKNQHAGGAIGAGRAGLPPAATGGDRTGTFWFFDPGNVELIVKALDGRAVNGHLWIFLGALTDLEYWVKVTDTATGRVRVYHNPAGNQAALGDTTALAAGAAPAATVLAVTELARRAPSAVEAPSVIHGAASACAAGPATLCLQGGRFRVDVDWKTATAAGDGHAARGTDASGTFWFFDAGNTELVVKILDGRAVNGRFWVFYGALTDVEYWFRVTDTATGVVRTYHNPAGTLAGRSDTSAF